MPTERRNMIFVITVAIVAIAILQELYNHSAELSDAVMILFSSVVCLSVTGWGFAGAKAQSKPNIIIFSALTFVFGMSMLTISMHRYPPLDYFSVGSVSVFAFLTLSLGVSWKAVRNYAAKEPPSGSAYGGAGINNAAAIYLFFGILFFQPLCLLFNGQGNARPVLVVPGTIADLYQTGGRGVVYYVVFTGPAAHFSSTGAAGEFVVTAKTYLSSHVGMQRCVMIHTGLLRFRWWEIKDC